MSRMSLAPGRAREYETIYIQRPTVDKEAVDEMLTRVADAIRSERGRITEIEFWGRRRLAYTVQRHHRGIYVYVKFLGHGNAVAELERQLRLADTVIRYQTVLVRNNVPFEGADIVEADTKLDYELVPEPDEPEITRERELGLDVVHAERGRGRRDDRDRDDQRGVGAGPGERDADLEDEVEDEDAGEEPVDLGHGDADDESSEGEEG